MEYTELNLKTKRAFASKFFKEHNITLDDIGEERLVTLNTLLEDNITKDRKSAFFQMLISETSLENDLLERFRKFCNSKQNTEEFFRLKLGDKLGIKNYTTNNKNKGNGNTLEGQIKKYGKVEGTRRHKEMNAKRAHTLENFIRIYGKEKGKEMYESTMSKKGLTLERMKEKYGDELGEQKFNEWKEKCKSTEENFIKRHGTDLGKKKWEEFKEKSKSTKENFIRIHGKELGEEKYKAYCKRSANTKENFIRVHGITEGNKRWKNYKNSNAGYRASGQSLVFFDSLTDILLKKKMNINDIWYGSKDSLEFKIEKENKVYSYDYTILPLKLIFEFNGNHVHPSKDLLGEKWNEWKCVWSGETADDKHNQDMKKIKIAEKEGFTVIEIWDYKDEKESLDNCLKLVEERI